MKKIYHIFIPVFIVLFILIVGAKIVHALEEGAAANLKFSAPVPAKSATSQTGPGVDTTKVDATHITFFKHPGTTEADANFSQDFVTIGGCEYPVNDLAATPGLLPKDRVVNENSPLFDPFSSAGVSFNPLHGFCPAPFDVGGVMLELNCQVGGSGEELKVYSSRQLQVGDIRNDFFDGALIGSAEEDISPYDPSTYPATILSGAAVSKSYRCECTGADICLWREISDETSPAPYDEVIAYGIANLERGTVIAAYDSFYLTEKMEILSEPDSRWQDLNPLLRRPHSWFYMSPLAFFRKDEKARQMKLGGYSAYDVRNYFAAGRSGEKVLGVAIDIHQNINPIAAVPMWFSGSEGFAVVNQTTIADLDSRVVLGGDDYIDPDESQHRWHDYLFYRDSGGSFHELGADKFPHRVFSYVTFWREESNPSWGERSDSGSLNPNIVFQPQIASIVGPGMFHAAKVTDRVVVEEISASANVDSLVVPSGEPAEDGKYYLYKIDPTRKNFLYAKMDDGLLSISADPVQLRVTLPAVTKITALPAGFAPYNIACGDLNGDDCGDCAITFRGAETVAVHPEDFANEMDQHVRFSNGRDDQNMFSDYILIYYGVEEDNECLFKEELDSTERIKIRLPNPKIPAQVAAIAIGDVDDNGFDDIIAGDLVPRRISAREEDRRKFTAYAYIYLRDSGGFSGSLAKPLRVRTGFETSDFGREIDAQDIVDIVEGGNAAGDSVIIGVSALALDYHAGVGANIGAINGIPLMLPKNGCPSRMSNSEIYSIGEMLVSGSALPERCGARENFCGITVRYTLPIGPQTSSFNMPGNSACCTQDPCSSACVNDLCIVNPVFCDRVLDITLGGETCTYTPPRAGNDDIQSSDDESQFAWRPDEVHVAQGHYIADIKDMVPAGGMFPGRVFPMCTEDSFGTTRTFSSEPDLPMNLDEPLMPRGKVMPGHREMTWVVNMTRGRNCPEVEGGGETPQGGEDTDGSQPGDGEEGGVSGIIPPGGGSLPIAAINLKNDCTSRVLTYSGNEAEEKIRELNREYIQKPTGRLDLEAFVEEGQTICFVCRFEDAVTPSGVATLSASKNAVPAASGDIMPQAFIQTGGSELFDMYSVKYKTVKPLTKPQLILPLTGESAGGKSAVAIPNLTNPELASASPLPVTSQARLSGNGMMINNMIESRTYISPAGKPFNLNMGGDVVVNFEAQPSEVAAEEKGAAIVSYCVTQPLGYATYTGAKGYTWAPNIEDLQLDPQKLADELASRAKNTTDAALPTSDILDNAPWESYLNQRFTVAAETASGPQVRKVASFGAPSAMFESGGGCKSCKSSISGLSPNLTSVLPSAIAILVALGGIVAGELRARRAKRRK